MSCILEFVVASAQSVLRFQLRVMLSIFRQVMVVVVIVVVGLVVEAWNQFNQSQPGGQYTAEAPQYGQQQLQQPFTNTRGQNNALSTALGAGSGALQGPTLQQIQGYMT